MSTHTKPSPNPLHTQIEKIRRQYEAIKGESAPLITIEHLLSNVSDSLYSSEYRFVLELLQNAVDSYRVEGGRPVPVEVRFELTPEMLIVSNDGAPFSVRDIERICGLVRERKVKKIGYKGIGFKSVASITENAQIYSPGCQFEFNKKYHPEYEYVWLVIPRPIPEEKIPPFVDRERVTFVLPFHQRARSEQLFEEFSNILNPRTGALLLFLEHLGQLELRHPSSRQSFTMRKRLDEASGLTLIERREAGGGWQPLGRWLVTAYRPQGITPEAREDYIKRRGLKLPENSGEQLDVSDTRISLAFHLDDNNQFVKKRGPLYAFFPVHQQSSGFNFTIQADFLTTISREALAIPSPWNDWLIENIPAAIEAGIEVMKRQPAYAPLIYEVLPLQDNQAIEKPFKEAVRTLLKRLRERPVVLTDLPRARWVTPAQAAWLAPGLRHLLTNQDLRRLRPEKRAFISFRLQNEPAKTFLTSRQGLGVEEIGEADLLGFLGQEGWLDYKPPEWFIDLFDFLAERLPGGRALEQLGHLPLLPTNEGLARPDDPAVFLPAENGPAGVSGARLVHPALLAQPGVAAFLREALRLQPLSVLGQIEAVILPRLSREGAALGAECLAEYLAFVKEGYFQVTPLAERDRALRSKLEGLLFLPAGDGSWQPARALCLAEDAGGEPTLAGVLLDGVSPALFVQSPPDELTFDFYRWAGVATEPPPELLLEALAGEPWFAAKPPEWFQQLYSYLESWLRPADQETLRALPLIPVPGAGGAVRLYPAAELFLPTPNIDEQLLETFAGDELTFVELSWFPQPRPVRRFLEKLGIEEFRPRQALERFVLPRFEAASRTRVYEPLLLNYTALALETFRAASSDPALTHLFTRFKAAIRLKSTEGDWYPPAALYLTRRYGSHDFEALLAGFESAAFVSEEYLELMPEPALWRQFLINLGVIGQIEQVPLEDVKAHLRALKERGQATAAQCLEIYGFLARRGEIDFLEEESLIYLPASGRAWWKPSELFWDDYREIFGEQRGYVGLEPAYGVRRATFKALGVNAGPPTAEDLAKFRPQEPPAVPPVPGPATVPEARSASEWPVAPEEAAVEGKSPLIISPDPRTGRIEEAAADYELETQKTGRWGEVYAYRWLRAEYARKYPEATLEETESGFKVTLAGQIRVDVHWYNKKGESMGKIDLRVVEDGAETYWEVKSSRALHLNQPLRLSMQEWEFARDRGEQFRLLRVLGAGSSNPELIILQNPYKLWEQGLLRVEPVTVRMDKPSYP